MPSQRASQKATPRRIVSPQEEVDELADDSSSSEESGSDEGEEWEARAILDERTVRDPSANRSRRAGSSSSRAKSSSAPRTITQYLIDWEGFDPATGKRWKPTWENAEGATQGLVDDWKKRKAEDPDLFGRYSRNLEEQKWRVVSPEKPKTKSASKQGSSSKSKSLNMAGGVASDSHRSVPAQEPTPRSTQGKRQKSVTSVPPAGSQTATGGKRKRSPHKRTSPPPPLSSSVSPPSQWGSAYGRAKRQKINVPIKPATQFTHTSKGDSPRPPESPSVVDDSQPLLPLTSSDERSAVLNSASTPLPVITTQPVSSRRQSKSKVPASPLSPPPTAAPNDTSTHSANPPPPPVVQDPRASRNHRPQPTDAGSSAESEPEASLDVSASQAEALRRAIDLLMDEEEFLEERERQSSVVVGASHEQAPAPAQVQAQAGQMPTAEKSAAAAGAGAAVEEKSGEPSIHTGKSTIQLLHPVPQITPTAFHELGMHTSAVGDSFTTSNTQPPEESILDFDDSATQGVHPSATILQPDVSGTEILQTEEMRVEAADRVTPSGTRELDGEMAAVDMEDSAESLVPVLGEDNWSRVSLGLVAYHQFTCG
ncbi:hypothetical protein QFC19_008197 [Naganishia cerealis]|uniref:Uncharacterized protein n=1 Tax=Naganishia cerealis TaxID=610337 RepID=A0ACC2V331_9TREE|nr:hypothetical protein QFC19_008197 [Naganishia cerealis]